MSPDDQSEVESVFMAVLEAADASRVSLLDQRCEGRPELRAEVLSLLAAHDRTGSMFGAELRTAIDGHAAPTREDGPTVAPGARIAHYRLDERLGAGGMGEVFRAWDLALGRPAAIKLIRRGVPGDLPRRLLREVEASARLQHPTIATFYEGGEDAGQAYFAMELVSGSTLRRRIEAGAVPPAEAITIAAGLLEALAHAHAAGILHRDIKPENIMLGATGSPKLLDFGLARRLYEPDEISAATRPEAPHLTASSRSTADADRTVSILTAEGSLPGTPGYMSPEQWRGEPLGPPSDLFQVGAVLYEMLTGNRAFARGSIAERLQATLAGPPDLTPLRSMTPAGLDAFVGRLLALHPADRFASAGECLIALEALSTGAATASTPGSIAVLDFANQTGDDSHDWIGMGISEGIRAELARGADVRVAPRLQTVRTIAMLRQKGGSFGAADVALALGLRWAVDGAFERTDNELRVRFEILEAATRQPIHRGRLSGGIDRVVDLRARVSQAVADALHVERRARQAESAGNERALELYTRARLLWQAGSGDPRILALLDEAIRAAPDYVPALAAMVPAYATRFIGSANPADLEQAIAVSDRVLVFDPDNSEALVWRGYALFRLERFDEALEVMARAVDVGGDDPFPSYTYAAALQALQHPDEALVRFQRAVQLEPKFGIAWLGLGWTLFTLEQYRDARYPLTRSQALEGLPGPTFVSGIGGYLAECLRCEGRLDEGRAAALAGLDAIERADNLYRDTVRAFCLGSLGRVAWQQGDREAAEAAFSQAIAQMRSRTRTQGGGQVLVQALAGQAAATGDTALLREGLDLFGHRQGYSFRPFYGCDDWFTLLQLSEAAASLGRGDEAASLRARAVAGRQGTSRARR